MPRLWSRFHMKLAVFSYPPTCYGVPDHRCGVRGEWIVADPENVAALFASHPRQRDDFFRFMERGCTGIFLVSQGQWISYGWYSKPGSRLPAHLPQTCRSAADYWIFYCRTREEFRSRGCYKTMLAQMACLIRLDDPHARIHIDTETSNTPSLRAIRAAGFLPSGLVMTYKFGLPFSKSPYIRGYWLEEAMHPLTFLPSAAPHPELEPELLAPRKRLRSLASR